MKSSFAVIQEPSKVKVKHDSCKVEDSNHDKANPAYRLPGKSSPKSLEVNTIDCMASLNALPSHSSPQQITIPCKPTAHASQEKSAAVSESTSKEALPTKLSNTDTQISPNADTAVSKSTGARDSASPATTAPAVEQDVEQGSSSATKPPPRKLSRGRVVLIFIQCALLVAQLALLSVDWHIYRSMLHLPGHPARIFRPGGLVILNLLYFFICECWLATPFPAWHAVMMILWLVLSVSDLRLLRDETSACAPADEACLAFWALYHRLGWGSVALGSVTM